jgi:hypothetical protein
VKIATIAQDNLKFKEEEEFNVVMKIYFQTCVLQKFEHLFTCECGYQGHVINAQASVCNTSSIHVSFFFRPQCLFKAGSFVVDLHKSSSPPYTSTINYVQNRLQMFVQIHYRAPTPTLLCNAKSFLFCGKHLKCSNGQHITAYCFTKIMMQTKRIAI